MFNNSPQYLPRNTGTKLTDIIDISYCSLVDKVTYNTKITYDSLIEDLDKVYLGKPVKSAVNTTSHILEKTKTLNGPLVKATCVSVVANVAVSYLLKDNNWGYMAESLGYSLSFPCFYWLANKDSNVSNNKTRVGIDLIVLGAASFLLSAGPYRIGRNEVIDTIIKNNYFDLISDPDLLRSTAAGVTQFVLMPLYMLALNPVKKGIDYLDKRFKFKSKLVESIPTPTEMFNSLFGRTKPVSDITDIKNSESAKSPIHGEVRPDVLPIITSLPSKNK